MKKIFKTTALAVLMVLSFAVFVEAFGCPEEKAQATGAPAECCVQCCPRHNMAPPALHLGQISSAPSFAKSLAVVLPPHSILLPDSVFHPPRA
ncbi:MAG: hypothetical protein U1F57_04355 [bacterium]